MPKRKNGKKPALHYLYRKKASGELVYVGTVSAKTKAKRVYVKRAKKGPGRPKGSLSQRTIARRFGIRTR